MSANPTKIADTTNTSDLTNRIVVLKEEAVLPAFRHLRFRVVRATGGFGVAPDHRDRKVYVVGIADRERWDVRGRAVERFATPEEIIAHMPPVQPAPQRDATEAVTARLLSLAPGGVIKLTRKEQGWEYHVRAGEGQDLKNMMPNLRQVVERVPHPKPSGNLPKGPEWDAMHTLLSALRAGDETLVFERKKTGWNFILETHGMSVCTANNENTPLHELVAEHTGVLLRRNALDDADLAAAQAAVAERNGAEFKAESDEAAAVREGSRSRRR